MGREGKEMRKEGKRAHHFFRRFRFLLLFLLLVLLDFFRGRSLLLGLGSSLLGGLGALSRRVG